MDERYERAKEIFLAVCDLDTAARATRLDEACENDAELRAEVESLLAHHGGGQSDVPPTATAAPSLLKESERERSPQRIGQYRVIRELGRGGMGVVYLAVRDDDQFKQHVAIKVLKRGMDTAEILRRFELERQVLAALNHAGIARLYNAGETDQGRPYFAMEYVEGQAINDYCDTHRLHIAERLRLFQNVCSAVHYAHQNLVVHRDLKPGNIVVNRDGVPKLLDFGIAKLINPGMSSFAGDPTAPDIRVMTPAYASPEQARGDPIGTASDIYSLGVLLYELVTGHRPYRLTSRVDEEIRRVICEVDPEKPSTAVSKVEEIETDGTKDTTGTTSITPENVSKVREGRPDRLRRRLAGDVDNIVLMAMRKEPQRRYRSAEQFSEDIGRHLDGMPVIARRDTTAYRLSKFVRRHRVSVGAAAAITLAITLGIVGTTMGYFAQQEQRLRADEQRLQADEQRLRAESMLGQVVGMAQAFIFDFHDEIAPLDGSMPARELLVENALEYLEVIAKEAGDNFELRRVLADSYDKLGSIQGGIRNAALGHTQEAIESYFTGLDMRLALANERPDDLELRRAISNSHMHLGDLYGRTGDMESAMSRYATALEIAESLAAAGPIYKRTLGIHLVNFAKALFRFGRRDEARRGYEHALAIRRDLVADEPGNSRLQRDLSVVLIRLAAMRAVAGDDAGAQQHFTEAVEIRGKLAAADPHNGRFRRDLGVALYYTAEFLISRDQVDEATEAVARFLAISTQRLQDNPNDARSRLDLATAIELSGIIKLSSNDLAGARRDFRELGVIMGALAATDPTDTRYQVRLASSHRRMADVYDAEGDAVGAALGYERAIEILTTQVNGDPGDVYLQLNRAEVLQSYGDVLLAADSLAEAQERLDEAVAVYRTLLERQPDHADVRRGLVKTLQSLARAMEARGYTESAITYAREALTGLTSLSSGPATDALRASIEEDLRRYRQ